MTVHGQRRLHSSLAKPIPVASIPSYTISNFPPPQQDQPLNPVSTTLHSPLEASHPTTSDPPTVADLRASIDSLQIHLYEPLEAHFRPFVKRKPKTPRKQLPSQEYLDQVHAIWGQYRRIVDKDQLTRSDYATLMRTFRLSRSVRNGARFILNLKDDMEARGMMLTRKMQEMVILSHIALKQPKNAIKVFKGLQTVLDRASAEYKGVMWTMVDGYGARELAIEGFAFLDQQLQDHDVEWMQKIYSGLLFRHLHSIKVKKCCSEQGISLLCGFADWSFPPPLKDFEDVLTRLEQDTHGGRRLLHDLSRSISELFVSTKQQDLLTPLIVSLVRASQLSEAARVVSTMRDRNLHLNLDSVRQRLIGSLDTCENREEQEGILEQWEELTSQYDLSFIPVSAVESNMSPAELMLSRRYSRTLAKCIENHDFEGADLAAQYITSRGWSPRGVDFWKLNSMMVNFGKSEDYIKYLEVRYTLGGWAQPDLHAYRRLVYAACRRSDLFTALSLFKLVRTRQPTWTLDPSIYNAIISTAGATGHIRVAEKTLSCMLEDGQKPDYFSFHGLLNGYCQAGDLDAAILVPEKMVKQKLVPNTKTFNLIMKAYLTSRQDVTTSRKLFKVMQQSVIVPPDLVTFNQLLEGYRRVGNTTWFDAYFDQYFGSVSRTSRSKTGLGAAKMEQGPRNQHAVAKIGSGSRLPVIRPSQTDDTTLLIQLKYSLALPTLESSTVWTLWGAIEPRVDQRGLPRTDPSIATTTDGTSTTTATLPTTHVPFNRMLGPVLRPVTEHEHFRFKVLTLFRTAFQTRGDTKGVKRIDRYLHHDFPGHAVSEPRSKPNKEKKEEKKEKKEKKDNKKYSN
ncbi:hypothetical protein BGZ93_008462 [Podila epicladia]|nr:hypothetical protein BGZ93_008462 [Podila epicladia]